MGGLDKVARMRHDHNDIIYFRKEADVKTVFTGTYGLAFAGGHGCRSGARDSLAHANFTEHMDRVRQSWRNRAGPASGQGGIAVGLGSGIGAIDCGTSPP